MTAVPPALAPGDDEVAVLSMLIARHADEWQLVCGSLLTMPRGVAYTSPQRWNVRQPTTPAKSQFDNGFDIGPIFSVEPFKGIRAVRSVVEASEWPSLVATVEAGFLSIPSAQCRVKLRSWSATVLLGLAGVSPAHHTIVGARRPVTGVVATVEQPRLPHSEDTWSLQLHDLDSPVGHRPYRDHRLLHWPRELLGIDWLGSNEFSPPARFTVGRILNNAWIADVRPDFESSQLGFVLCWDERRIDPLSCTLAVRVEDEDHLPLVSYQVRISDLPHRCDQAASRGNPEPRTAAWHERTLSVWLPRGPRRTDWAVSLFSPDGRLLDERPMVPRIEQISLSIHVGDSAAPSSQSLIGDPDAPPDGAERAEVIASVTQLMTEARHAAAGRRFSTAGELERYLQWRFSHREGELLLLDPHLLDGDWVPTIEFLERLHRPVRALARAVPNAAATYLRERRDVDIRDLPNGKATLHDRIWLVGETGLAVGTSINGFLRGARSSRATTATELPSGDAERWRQRFEGWWPNRR